MYCEAVGVRIVQQTIVNYLILILNNELYISSCFYHIFIGSREHYMCDTEVDLCYSSPCLNNGTCIRREGGYSCVCAAGFTGKNFKVSI